MKVSQLVARLLLEDQDALIICETTAFGRYEGVSGITKVEQTITNAEGEDFNNVVAIELEG